MPIYAYRCAACGHARDVLRKLSDPLLTVCPACGAAQFSKQVTAAGFQLKGSGWYATDFKGGGAAEKKPADKAEKADGNNGAAAADGKPAAAPQAKADAPAAPPLPPAAPAAGSKAGNPG